MSNHLNEYLSVHIPGADIPKMELADIAMGMQEALQDCEWPCEIAWPQEDEEIVDGFYLVFKDPNTKELAEEYINEQFSLLEAGEFDELDEEFDFEDEESSDLPIDVEIALLALGDHMPSGPKELQTYLANYDGSDNPPPGWEEDEWGGPFPLNDDEAVQLYGDIMIAKMFP